MSVVQMSEGKRKVLVNKGKRLAEKEREADNKKEMNNWDIALWVREMRMDFGLFPYDTNKPITDLQVSCENSSEIIAIYNESGLHTEFLNASRWANLACKLLDSCRPAAMVSDKFLQHHEKRPTIRSAESFVAIAGKLESLRLSKEEYIELKNNVYLVEKWSRHKVDKWVKNRVEYLKNLGYDIDLDKDQIINDIVAKINEESYAEINEYIENSIRNLSEKGKEALSNIVYKLVGNLKVSNTATLRRELKVIFNEYLDDAREERDELIELKTDIHTLYNGPRFTREEYRIILSSLHPDKGGNAKAFDIFKKVILSEVNRIYKANPKLLDKFGWNGYKP